MGRLKQETLVQWREYPGKGDPTNSWRGRSHWRDDVPDADGEQGLQWKTERLEIQETSNSRHTTLPRANFKERTLSPFPQRSELKTLACLHITLGRENMLRSTEEVHYRMISLLEKCRCKGNAGTGLVSMLSCCMGASPLPPCTAPALLKIFLRIIFYLPLYQLLQSPHRARLPHQSLLSLTGN